MIIVGVFRNVFDRAISIMAVLSGVIVILSMLVVSLGVLSRYLLNWPWGWVVEVTEYGLVYMTFLAAAWILKKERHVRMDLIFGLLSPKTRSVVTTITFFISSIVCLVLTWFGIRITWELLETKYFTVTVLEIPKFIVVGVIPVGFCLLFVQFVKGTLTSIATWRGSKTTGKER